MQKRSFANGERHLLQVTYENAAVTTGHIADIKRDLRLHDSAWETDAHSRYNKQVVDAQTSRSMTNKDVKKREKKIISLSEFNYMIDAAIENKNVNKKNKFV